MSERDMSVISEKAALIATLNKQREELDLEIELKKSETLDEIVTTAKAQVESIGISIAELIVALQKLIEPAKESMKKSAAPAKYVNPSDPNQKWSGRGVKPLWVKSALETGKSLADLEI